MQYSSRSTTISVLQAICIVQVLHGQEQIEIGDKASCETCRVELEHVVTLGRAVDSIGVSRSSLLVRDRRGFYYATAGFNKGRVIVYGPVRLVSEVRRSLKMLRALLGSTIILSALAACSKQGPRWNGDVSVSVDTAANGTIDVINFFPEHLAPDRLFQEDLRLGTVDGGGPEVFSSILGVAVGRDGSIYVLDHHDQDIRVFDSTGTFIFAFGGRGGGPGEFQAARGLRWSPSGNLWVLDNRNARYSEFTPTGRFRQSYKMTFFVGQTSHA
ncbi:MAG: 6-bladed beta-propeller [Gemmatimonadales bacterium]